MVTERMRLDGIHHITGITGDGQRCLDFYAGILGLAFVGRDQDFEAPDSHLIRLGYQPGGPAGILNFIEAPGIGRGRAGNGMAYLLSWSVRFPAALDYWADRLSEAGIRARSDDVDGAGPRLRFADPEGMEHELTVDPRGGGGFALASAAIPPEHAIVSLAGIRAYGRESVPSADILAGRLGFKVTGRDRYLVEGGRGASGFAFDPAPLERGHVGTGTIHHVAWASDGGLPAWRQRVIGMGCRATPVIDRGHCRSIYFREPSGVLFEIATHGASGGDGSPGARLATGLSATVDPRVRTALVS
jgi:glyoxalase family protein